ncbi:MAG: type II toxin-antitoxin system RelE/ParE family toxin [Alphaproteobacteria bacterium]|nr:type II toxin-antitoxin system RelE/ParE family toxin [Alphaproteobacteria bacterium]
MEWRVLLDENFEAWLGEQKPSLQNEILAHAQLLAAYGPMLGRPRVDSIKGSKFPNMKELRIQWKGEPWRILFAFDTKRRSVLLVGGNKQGDKRWYDKNIPIADTRFAQHLKEMEKENGKKHQ